MTALTLTCALWTVLALAAAQAQGELPRVFLPAPEVARVEHSVGERACADEAPFLALVLVMSHTDNFDKRQAMRDAYPDAEIATLGVRRAFVVGTKRDVVEETDDRWSRSNSSDEPDLLLVNSTDTYDCLAAKVLASFAWAAHHCQHARFIAKADDDMFVDWYALGALLAAIPDNAVDDLRGHLHADNVNPTPYLAGGFYLTSPNTLKAIAEAARWTEMFMHVAEDVYFTGLLADRVGAVRVDEPAVRHWEGAPHCCVDGASGVVYGCQYAVFEDRRGMTGVLARRFKAHGRFCYHFECQRFTGALLAQSGLTCFR